MTQDYLHLYLNWTDPNTGTFQTVRLLLDDTSEPVVITLGRDLANMIVVENMALSVHHADLVYQDNTLTLKDLDSLNGTWVEGERIQEVTIDSGSSFQIGPVVFSVSLEVESAHPDMVLSPTIPGMSTDTTDESLTTAFARSQLDWLVTETRGRLGKQVDTTPQDQPAPSETAFGLGDPQIDLGKLSPSGSPFPETTYLTLGGGLGSFVWVDRLMMSGVASSDVTVIGMSPDPAHRFHQLCRNSQIPDDERLRCHSHNTLDNMWGWPGYGLREISGMLQQGHVRQAIQIACQMIAGPVLSSTYQPRLGDVIEAINREAARIGWDDLWRFGVIHQIRQTTDGRYAVAYSPTGQPSSPYLEWIVADTVHIAFGAPGIRFEPDLQSYRVRTGDFRSVVNAYEQHEHVYQDLASRGGDVLLRGTGMTAARILHRLMQEHRANPDIHIIHLRDQPRIDNRLGFNRRRIENHWEYQIYDWPEGVYSGHLLDHYRHADSEERDLLRDKWGGPTIIPRRDWMQYISKALSEGWYQIRFGSIEQVQPTESGQLVTTIRGNSPVHETTRVTTHYIIDATDLRIEVGHHPMLGDLIATYHLDSTSTGAILVSDHFEIEGLRNGAGRVYLCGYAATGGPYPAAATFTGLQVAAQYSIEQLRTLHAPGIRRVNGLRSLRQWINWMRGAPV